MAQILLEEREKAMRGMLFGILLSASVFAILSWATTKRTVHAEVLTAPPAGRFQVVRLHAQSGAELSGVLDTETGCTLAYVSSVRNEEPNGGSEQAKRLLAGEHAYLMLLGGGLGFFGAVNYAVQGYVNPFKPAQGSSSKTP